MIAMPLDLCPSPLAVELALLLCSEVVVAKQLLNVGVEDVTPETFSVNACTRSEISKKCVSHQTCAPGAESRPCRIKLLVLLSSSGLAHLLVLIVLRTVLSSFFLFACDAKKPPVKFRISWHNK